MKSRSLLDEETRAILPISPPRQIMIRDPVAEANTLRYEINIANERYANLALSKESSDRRNAELQTNLTLSKEAAERRSAELQAEAEVARIKNATMKSEYDARVANIEADLKTSRGESASARQEHEAHLVQCRAASATYEKRIAELELQLKSSGTELSTHLRECSSAEEQAKRRIAEVEGQHKKTTDELSELMKKFMDLSAAKAKTDTMNSELQEYKSTHSSLLVDRDARLKEAQGELDRLTKLLADATTAKTTTTRTVLELQSQAKRDNEEICSLRKQHADLVDTQAQEHALLVQKHQDEVTSLRKQLADLGASHSASTATALRAQQEAVDSLKHEIALMHTATAAARVQADGVVAELTVQKTRLIDDLTAHKNRLADELSGTKKLLGEAIAAKAGVESSNSELIGQTRRDALDKERLATQLADLSTAMGALERRCGEGELLAKRVAEEGSKLRAKLLDSESLLRKSMDEVDRLKSRLEEVGGAKGVVERELEACRSDWKKATEEVAALKRHVGQLEGERKKDKDEIAALLKVAEDGRRDQQELERTRKVLVSSESLVRKHADEAERLTKAVGEMVDLKGSAEKELEGLRSQGKKDADAVAALKRVVAEGEIQARKDAATVARVGLLLSDATAAKSAADRRITELEAQGRKDSDEIGTLKKRLADVEFQGKKDTAELFDALTKASTIEADVSRLKRQVADLTTGKSAADKLISEGQAHQRNHLEALDTAKQQLTEVESLRRRDRDEVERLGKLLSDATEAKGAAERALSEATLLAKRDTMKKDLEDALSAHRKGLDQISRLEQALSECTTAKGGAEKAAADLGATVGRLKEELERVRKQAFDQASADAQAKGVAERGLAEVEERRRVEREELGVIRVSLASLAAAKGVAEGRASDLEVSLRRCQEEVVHRTRAVAELEALVASTADAADRRVGEAQAQGKKDADEWARARRDLAEEVSALRRRVADGEALRAAQEAEGKLSQTEVGRLGKLLAEATAGKTGAEQAVAMVTDQGHAAIAELQAQVKGEREEVAAVKRQLIEAESQARKDKDEIERLTKLLAEATTAKMAADKEIVTLTAQSKANRAESEKQGRQLIETESLLRTAEDESERFKKLLADATTALAAVKDERESEVAGYKAQLRADADDLSALRKKLVDCEGAVHRGEVEVDRLTQQVGQLTAAKGAAEGAGAVLQEEYRRTMAALEQANSELTTRCKRSADEVSALQNQLHTAVTAAAAAETDATTRLSTLGAQCTADRAAADALRGQIIDWELRSRKEADHAERLQEQVERTTAALKGAEASLVDVEDLLKREKEENERLRRTMIDHESDLRRLTDEGERLTAQLAGAAAARGVAEGAVDVLEAQGKKDADEIAALKRQLADAAATADKRISELEALGKKDADEWARARRDLAEEVSALRRRVADGEALRAAQEAEGKLSQAEVGRLGKLWAEATAGRTGAEQAVAMVTDQGHAAIAELQAQVKGEREEVAAVKRQLIEAESQARKDKDEIERLTKLLAEATTAKTAAEQSLADLTAQSKVHKGEIEKQGRQLIEAESQARKDKDEIERLKKLLADATAAKTAADKEIVTLTAQSKADKMSLDLSQRDARKDKDEIERLTKLRSDLADSLQAEVAAAKARYQLAADEVEGLKKQLVDAGTDAAATNAAAAKDAAAAKAAADKRIAELVAAVHQGHEKSSSQTRLVQEKLEMGKRLHGEEAEALRARGIDDAKRIEALQVRKEGGRIDQEFGRFRTQSLTPNSPNVTQLLHFYFIYLFTSFLPLFSHVFPTDEE